MAYGAEASRRGGGSGERGDAGQLCRGRNSLQVKPPAVFLCGAKRHRGVLGFKKMLNRRLPPICARGPYASDGVGRPLGLRLTDAGPGKPRPRKGCAKAFPLLESSLSWRKQRSGHRSILLYLAERQPFPDCPGPVNAIVLRQDRTRRMLSYSHRSCHRERRYETAQGRSFVLQLS
jgi:hypothetical protein